MQHIPTHCTDRKPVYKNFMDMGLKAAFVGEVQDDHSIEKGVMNGEYSLVYMSPESMMTLLQWRELFHSQLYQQCLKGIMINETHCVSVGLYTDVEHNRVVWQFQIVVLCVCVSHLQTVSSWKT